MARRLSNDARGKKAQVLGLEFAEEGALEVTDWREDGEDQRPVGLRLVHRCMNKEQRAYHRRSRDQRHCTLM